MNPRIGVIGAGHFGRFHTLKLKGRGLSGLHDPDPSRAALVAAEAGTEALALDALIERSEALIIAAPTPYHFALASRALEAGRHVLVEKPIAATLEEADALIALAARKGLVLMVGQIERHSAAIRTLRAECAGRRLRALEAVRVASFRPRSLDVSVVLDLMIHDLDLVMALTGADLAEVQAVGGRAVSEQTDWAVAHLLLTDGTRATVTASRIAVGLERRLRALGPEGELRVDFLARTLDFVAPGGAEPMEHLPGWGTTRRSWVEHDSLEAEHDALRAAIAGARPYEADGAAGRAALDAALRVEAALSAPA
ncbi:Gfo/Idh/MocA family protein [Sabulicella glaciei]|uniref:Gfo/Idh/MocA family oxidoreductase n=1 Tax=Sabulicella glaciei TaxID=2984948 RepID=A0ABT3NR55_9PROT|nr:Gfo/Idh/MocA family oxidoreductase [Roseococcus sp. MDT2-1-1]MCW8084644.1 Gfo/Idh/MocA family oxidoreductase [Roseococcus sp. MDT2-1-1]